MMEAVAMETNVGERAFVLCWYLDVLQICCVMNVLINTRRLQTWLKWANSFYNTLACITGRRKRLTDKSGGVRVGVRGVLAHVAPLPLPTLHSQGFIKAWHQTFIYSQSGGSQVKQISKGLLHTRKLISRSSEWFGSFGVFFYTLWNWVLGLAKEAKNIDQWWIIAPTNFQHKRKLTVLLFHNESFHPSLFLFFGLMHWHKRPWGNWLCEWINRVGERLAPVHIISRSSLFNHCCLDFLWSPRVP